MKAVFIEKLTLFLAANIAGFQKLSDCQQLTAGASQETYRLLLQTDKGDQQLALRRRPSSIEHGIELGQVSLPTEAKLLQLAAQASIPVPEVIAVLGEKDELGHGFLMQWLDGETLGQRIVRSESLASIRPQLATLCGESLARLHTVELSDELRKHLPTVTPVSLINETWNSYKALNTPAPMIDYTARWLLNNLPSHSRQTLVHGDFRNGNLMINETGIVAVLDWELAQIGDPIRDLGWLCVNSWRFGKTDLPVGGFGNIDDLLQSYQQVSGIEVSMGELRFWQIFGSFWWSIATLKMADTWRTGETPSLERPVIGRRSSEAQMDCANLLIPGEFDLPDNMQLNKTEISIGTQLPMPAELLEGVKKFLHEDVAAADKQRFGFLAKVAASSLGIVQRELLFGATLATAENSRLRALIGEGSLDEMRWKLTKELRQDLDLATPGLDDHLRKTVAGQLNIDQPNYSALHSTKSL